MLISNKDDIFRNEFSQAFYLAKNTFVNEKYSLDGDGKLIQSSVDLTNNSSSL